MDIEKILELFENKKISDLRAILKNMNPVDIATLFEEIPEDKIPLLFRILPKELAADTFTNIDGDMQELLIQAFSDGELKEVFDDLYLDDTVDIIEEMPANVVNRILESTSSQMRRIINEVLKYPDDSAGSIMTIEYVSLKRSMTVEDAFNRIRRTGIDKETIYTCYVTDENRKLAGIVSVKTLLLSEPSCKIGDIMEQNIIYVETLEDKEVVARLFDKYGFLAIPVVDKEQRLVGIITVDDAIDVLQDENTEDFEKMAAISPSEESYFKMSVLTHAKNRILWLLVLMLSSTITGIIITNYTDTFATFPLLVAFIPMLMDTGGNCGSQTSTLIIRGLALEEIKLKDYFVALFKEIRIALVVGVVLSIINAIRIYLMYHDLAIALITAITLIFTIILAKMLGCSLPMIAKRLKLDPAIMASPLITTIVDACSVFLYFTIATALLGLHV
ncbi:MAG: magnesium transporter [Eubacteriales bacterium]